MSVMANKVWSSRILDIKNVFLNRDLNKKIYMTKPEGFINPEKPDWVCKILRSLYGLKQSPREWNKKRHGCLESVKLIQYTHNQSIYFFKEKNELEGLIQHICME